MRLKAIGMMVKHHRNQETRKIIANVHITSKVLVLRLACFGQFSYSDKKKELRVISNDIDSLGSDLQYF